MIFSVPSVLSIESDPFDFSEIYGVEVKRINEAVKNNFDKFPDSYIIDLSKEEWDNLKSKFPTSSWGGKRKLPKAFTEKGLYMIATIQKANEQLKQP